MACDGLRWPAFYNLDFLPDVTCLSNHLISYKGLALSLRLNVACSFSAQWEFFFVLMVQKLTGRGWSWRQELGLTWLGLAL